MLTRTIKAICLSQFLRITPAINKLTIILVPGYPQMLSVNMVGREGSVNEHFKAIAAQLAST
jgi:hypothetical protein